MEPEEQPSTSSHLTSSSTAHPAATQTRDSWRPFAELIRTALIVVVLAYLIRLFVVQPFIVDGTSMYPLFHNEDYLLVDKLSYSFFTEPQRGDVVVFRYPRNPDVNYVKRVIGLPGERVRIEDGRITIFNSEHPNGFILSEKYVEDGTGTYITNPGPSSTDSVVSEYTIQPNSYFVLGDNRGASSDSREWGLLENDKIIGRVILQAYPLNRFALVTHARYE